MGIATLYQDKLIKHAITAVANKMKKLDVREYIESAEAIANSVYMEFAGCRRERLLAYYIDIEGRIIKRSVSLGTIDSAHFYIREIVREALLIDAAGIILCHTHIANDADPSDGDLSVTIRLKDALSLFEILLYDHIIVSKSGYYSFVEEGLL